jgi:hypothetical protein
MASSTTQLSSEGVAGANELVPIRTFPQVERFKALPSDGARELYMKGTNNARSFWLLNRRYIEALDKAPLPDLSRAGRRVAADLKANGIAFAGFKEFFERPFWTSVKDRFYQYLDEYQRTATPVTKGKGVFLDTIHRAHTFIPDDVVSTYLGEPMIAAVAGHYMGMVPRFVGSSFWRTRAAGNDRMYSQLWHRDYNDRMLVKVFLYLTDVDQERGCFEFVAGSHERGALGHEFDRIGPDGYRAYPESADVDARVAQMPAFDLDAVPAEQRSGEEAPWHRKPAAIRCTAGRGTLIFADTFGLHRGGFVQTGHRDMIMTTYSTNFNVHPPHFAVTRGYADSLTPFMRLAFGVA